MSGKIAAARAYARGVKHACVYASVSLFALLAACSSSTSTGTADGGSSSGGASSGSSGASGGTSGTPTPPGGTSGAVPPAGMDSGVAGGFDFTFTSGGANTTLTAIKASPVYGAMCMGTAPNRECSFTGYVTASGCTGILNAGFVGTPTVGTSFPLVTDPTTPPGDAEVTYTETCGAKTKSWKATGGTLRLDKYTPPAMGFTTGTASFTITGATMQPSSSPGDATGNFTIDGTATDVQFSATS